MRRSPRWRSRAGASALVLAAIGALSIAAPWLAPRGPELMEDVAAARNLPPLTRAHAIRAEPDRTRIVFGLRRVEGGWTFTRAGLPGRVEDGAAAGPPEARLYLLGTDSLGRDLASRLLFGARHSMGIAVAAVAMALLIGVGVGAAAGLAAGWWDAVLMRAVDVFMSVPRLVIYLVCAGLFRPSTAMLVVVLGATTWTGLARLARAEFFALRGSDLAMAARAVGSSPLRLVLKHLIPAIGPVIAVTASLRFADTVLLESALAFLGLGSPSPVVSLGGIIASSREALGEAWWVWASPGLVLVAAVMSLRSAAAGMLRIVDPPSMS